MADVITRFKLETTQYDSALRDAAKGLSDLTKQLQLAGNDFNRFAEKNVETARALGKVESGASDVKDKLRDLVSAYNNVAKAYNNLTKEQQQSDFGKAMAQSLKELQGRIKDTKKEIEDLKDKSKGTGGILDQLAAKFGISTKQLMGWGAAIAAGTSALKFAKDAFFASEQNLDDWERTVYSAKSTYEAFLTSINTGDISGFLDRIGQITQAAMESYNAIDRLQTLKTIQSPQVEAKQSEIQRFENMLRTGRYIAPIDDRAPVPGMKSGDILTEAQKERIAKQLESAMKELAALTRNEIKAATDAINKMYREQALRLGMSNEQFRKGTASMAAFEANLEKARKYQEFEAQHTTRTTVSTSAGVITQSVRDSAVNPYEQYKGWSVFMDDGDLFKRIVENIQKRSQAESQYYSQMGRAYRGINRAEGVTPYGGSGKGGAAITQKEVTIQQQIAALEKEALTASGERLEEIREIIAGLERELSLQKQITDYIHGRAATAVGVMPGDIATQKAAIQNFAIENPGQAMINQIVAQQFKATQEADIKTLQTLLTTTIKEGITGVDIDADSLMRRILFGREDINDSVWQELQDKINEKLKEMNLEPIKLNFETGALEKSGAAKDAQKKNELHLGQLANNVLSITRSLNDLGVEIPEGLTKVLSTMNIITTILGTISTLAGITATTSAIKSIPIIGWFMQNGGVVHAANGFSGIVPGTSFSGDNIPAMLNSGETVLTAAQTNNVASLLANTGRGEDNYMHVFVESDQIKLLLHNGAQKRGMTISQYLEL